MSPLSALLPENPFSATTNPAPQPCSSRTGPAPTDRSAAPLQPQLYSQLGVGPGSRKPPPGLQPVLRPPQVLLLDLGSGAVLWSQALPGLPGDPPSASLPTADHRSAFFFWGVHKTTGSNQTVESWVLADSSGQAPWLGACKETEAPWGGQRRAGLGGWRGWAAAGRPRGGSGREGGQEECAELVLAFPRTQADTAPGEALVVSVGLTLHPTLTQEPGATGHHLYMLHPTLPGVLLELDSVSAPIVTFQGECAPRGPGPASCRRPTPASPPP